MHDWYPVHRQRYRLTFTVYDQAGNRSTASLEHRYGSTCGELPEPVAAHRPGSTTQFLDQAVFAGFKPWTNGDVLYENPVTLVWRLPRHNWYNENPYGIEFTPVYQDETYVYMKVKKPQLPAPNSNDGNWSTKTTWGCKAYNDFQGTLADGVGATPKLVSGDIALDVISRRRCKRLYQESMSWVKFLQERMQITTQDNANGWKLTEDGANGFKFKEFS